MSRAVAQIPNHSFAPGPARQGAVIFGLSAEVGTGILKKSSPTRPIFASATPNAEVIAMADSDMSIRSFDRNDGDLDKYQDRS